MKLRDNDIDLLRTEFKKKFLPDNSRETLFSSNPQNNLYGLIERKLFEKVAEIKGYCKNDCLNDCATAIDCQMESNKPTRYQLYASRRQLSQLLYEKSKHKSFYEGFVELCCIFLEIDFSDIIECQTKESIDVNVDNIDGKEHEVKGQSGSVNLEAISTEQLDSDKPLDRGQGFNRFFLILTRLLTKCVPLFITIFLVLASVMLTHFYIREWQSNSKGITQGMMNVNMNLFRIDYESLHFIHRKIKRDHTYWHYVESSDSANVLRLFIIKFDDLVKKVKDVDYYVIKGTVSGFVPPQIDFLDHKLVGKIVDTISVSPPEVGFQYAFDISNIDVDSTFLLDGLYTSWNSPLAKSGSQQGITTRYATDSISLLILPPEDAIFENVMLLKSERDLPEREDEFIKKLEINNNTIRFEIGQSEIERNTRYRVKWSWSWERK